MQDESSMPSKACVVSMQSDVRDRNLMMKIHLEQLMELCEHTEVLPVMPQSPTLAVVRDDGSMLPTLVQGAYTAKQLSQKRQIYNGSIDPEILQKIIRHRRLRSRFFGKRIFADPAWDMLLDLALAYAEGRRVTVSSLCHASGVPATTSLRWIGELAAIDLVERVHDDKDKRRTYVNLTARGLAALRLYFSEVSRDLGLLI